MKPSLIEREQSGLYLFHGSGQQVPCLEPRQAYTMIEGQNVPHGDAPGVYATEILDYAIFMAVVCKENCPKGIRSSCSSDETGGLFFSATGETLEQLDDNSSGYVHVLLRDNFVQNHFSEWVANTAVKPIEIIKVKFSDLMSKIVVLDAEHL